MITWVTRHFSSAHVLALTALFVALGGGAYAATKPAPNSVKSKTVKNDSLKGVDINEATLDGSQIPGIPTGGGGGTADGAGTGPAGGDLTGNYPNPTIKADAVTSATIADGSVANGDLADDSVNSAKIANFSISGSDLGDNSVTGSKIVNSAVSGLDVDEGTLGTVPSATNAETLDTIDSADFTQGKANVFHSATAVPNSATAVTPLFVIPGVGEINATCNGGVLVGAGYKNTSGATQGVSVSSIANPGSTPFTNGLDLTDTSVTTIALGSASFMGSVLVDRGSARTAKIDIAGYDNGPGCALQVSAVIGRN